MVKTGVISIHSFDINMLDQMISDGIDLGWRQYVREQGIDPDSPEADKVECDGDLEDNTYLYGLIPTDNEDPFIEVDEDKYDLDPEKDFAAILRMDSQVIQIIHSKFYVDGCNICSPCYPGQANLNESGSEQGYAPPPEYLLSNDVIPESVWLIGNVNKMTEKEKE